MQEEYGINILDSKYIKLICRTYYDEELNAIVMSQSASGFTVRFKGTSLTADLVATNYDIETKKPYIAIIVDENYNNPVVMSLDNAEINELVLASNLPNTEHEVTVIKRNEALESFFGLKKISTDGVFLKKVYKDRYIEVLGDSTISGYGNEVPDGIIKSSSNTNIMKTFTYLAAQYFDADYSIVCASGWGAIGSMWVNPHEMNLCEIYKNRYYGTLDVKTLKHKYSDSLYNPKNNRKPDVVVISMGANDLSYLNDGFNSSKQEGERRTELFINEYISLLKYITELNPNVEIFMITWLEVPMYELIQKTFERANMKNAHHVTVTGDMQASKHHPSAKCHIELSLELANEIAKVTGWEINKR